VWSALLVSFAPVVPALSQQAILSQGDPQLETTAEDAARREAIRDSLLKQQESRPSASQGESHDPNGFTRQDTGLSDPSVNPGQASGMQSVQGRIIKSEGATHIVRQLSGPDATLMVDARTAGDKDLHPGDVITGLISPQGRAVVIHKEHR
jgi:hypothetical protein